MTYIRNRDTSRLGNVEGELEIRQWRDSRPVTPTERRFRLYNKQDSGDGKLLYSGRNLVVTLGRRVMSRLLAGAVADSGLLPATITYEKPTQGIVTPASVSELFVTKMVWGSGGHDPASPSQAKSGTPALTDEYSDITPITMGGGADPWKSVEVDYTAVNKVRFTAVLESGDAVGETISEEGLLTDSHSLLVARRTFGLITKMSGWVLEFRHTIIF